MEARSGEIAEELHAALQLLLTAHDRTRAQNCNHWDLAVEIADLRSLGVMRADLRWLLSNNYLDHAIGWSRPGVEGRGFMLVGDAHLTDESCFVLTEKGVAFACDILRSKVPSSSADREAAMITITLPNGTWEYDPNDLLGPAGGFGAVYAGKSLDGNEVAVKKIHPHIASAAHRELQIAHELVQSTHEHVIPILDAGQDSDSGDLFVVMAFATDSLAAAIEAHGSYCDAAASSILLDIVRGLSEVSDLVHRDLKPQNVLQHDNVWKIADFGIARFAGAATSANTMRECLSPPYAAPEQWRTERCTHATDVYALGCIAHTLFRATPPFQGPETADYQRQHLEEAPPYLTGHSSRLVGLITGMLRKSPATRPSLQRVISVLEEVADGTSAALPALQALDEAAARDIERVAREEAEALAANNAAATRVTLAKEGLLILAAVVNGLFALVRDRMSTAEEDATLSYEREKGIVLQNIRCNYGVLTMRRNDRHEIIAPDRFAHSGWDVVLGASIEVKQLQPHYEWAASLWYAKWPSRSEYRWYDTGYCVGQLHRIRAFQPFALLDLDEADKALAYGGDRPIMLAYRPKPIEDEDFAAFAQRWLDGRFALASRGALRQPNLPLELMLPIAKLPW